jgi:hypothetical protein
VITRMPASKTSGDAGATPSARPATPAVTGSPAKNFDVNGTTWQIKGKENGRPWATIFSLDLEVNSSNSVAVANTDGE